MLRSRILALGVVIAIIGPLLGIGAFAGMASAAPAAPHGVSFTTYSLNWAGYVVTGAKHKVTEVTGSWIQPAVTCTKATTYAAFWAGIDGYSSNTVEQAGTLAYCSGGTAFYYAWYEFFPKASVEISSLSVSPGDTVSVTVSYVASAKHFSITVQVGSSSFTKTGKVSGAERTSAECIDERPTVGTSLTKLADFGTADFGSDYTSTIGCGATIGGTTGSFGSFSSAVAIDMEDSSGKILSSTGPLSSDGSSFVATWEASS